VHSAATSVGSHSSSGDVQSVASTKSYSLKASSYNNRTALTELVSYFALKASIIDLGQTR